jgi:hypothetical protein
MVAQMSGNYFNRYAPTTNLHPTGNTNDYKITQAVYSPEYITKITTFQKYTSYVQDRNGNKNLSSIDKVVTGLTDTLSSFNYEKDVVQNEGFGGNRITTKDPYLSQEEAFLTYINDSSKESEKPNDESLTSNVQMDNFKIKRGLLHYTQQIVNSGAEVGRNIAHNTKDYGISDSGMVLYKGSSECRSYTHFDQYNNMGKMMRFKGNGHEASVLKDSVMPKIYPTSSADTRSLMFSIENLAWTKTDLIAYGLPPTQYGSNGGRVMWFAPYGLSFSDNEQANYEATNLLGRIEPIYTHNGATRQMTLSFMLIIDTPPHVQYYSKEELAAWFAGCLQEAERTPQLNMTPLVIPKKQEVKVPSINNVPTPPTETLKNVGKYYFENNKFEIFHDPTNLLVLNYYETMVILDSSSTEYWRNLGGINMAFGGDNGELSRILQFMRTKIIDGFEVNFEIEGRCSALWTNIYNARLSYKRADAMMRYIINAYNQQYGARDGSTLSLLGSTNYDTVITLDYAKTAKPISYQTSNGLVKFKIKGVGEEHTKLGQEETDKNKLDVKKTRYAIVTSMEAKFVGNVNELQPLATREASLSSSESVINGASTSSNGNLNKKKPLREWFGNDAAGIGSVGWDKLDYYKPTFHSQTPYDFNERIQFLRQTTRPRQTIQTMTDTGSNNLFGKMPICVLRIGDFINSKVVVNNVNIDYAETTWDMNPEGMGMQPMLAKVTMDLSVIGAMALEWPVNKVLTANDFNFVANGDFHDKNGYYPKDRYDYQNAVKPSVKARTEGKLEPEDPRWPLTENKS